MSKKKYLCIQRSESGCEPKSPPSPEKMQKMYAEFNGWREKFADNIVDLGGKLGGGSLVNSEGASDGPFVEAKELVGGFMILQAESLEQAIEVAQGLPGLTAPGSSVEVREILTP